jgi:hypothetical protein
MAWVLLRHRSMKSQATLRRSVLTVLAAGLCACAAQSSGPAANAGSSSYHGPCEFVGVEAVAAPVDQEDDSLVVIARYRLGAGDGGTPRVAYRSQIVPDRDDDPRLQERASPSVVCAPQRDVP